MDNTEKLLRAFIEASGYEIEQVNIVEDAQGFPGISKLVNDYKVTKKHESPFPWMDTDSPAWSAIVKFVLDRKDIIESGNHAVSELKPVLDFFYGTQDETEYLLSSLANAQRLEESIKQFQAGEVIERLIND